MSELSPLESIFFAALEKAPAERAAYLSEACGGDNSLRHRVEKMLSAQAEAKSFLEVPPLAIGAQADATIDQSLSEQVGTQIGPYKLLQQIGEGGMGVVYMAEQTEPIARRVALKIIKPGMDTRQVIARFEAERQALAVMDHPNIAKVLDAGATESGRPYFVMELVRGVPITQYCDENNLPVRERLELFATVCQAIQHAHTKGIIHRDIKPTNVLVTRQDGQPVVKVIDFGVAKALGQELTDKTLFTEFAQMIGTPLYMSPEQAELSCTDIDTRSDIYSLGVLLYELLTGTTPVSKEQLKQAAFDEIRRIIREDEPAKPSTRISTAESALSIAAQRHTEPAKLTKLVRGELDWIVMKALDKDRNRRYETASGLAQDLQRYLADEPVQACPPTTGYRLQKFVSRYRGPVLAATLVVLALVAGIIGTTWGMIRAEHARDEAHARLAQIEKGTEILASVFQDVDPIAAEKAGVTSLDLLSQRLVKAAQQLEGDAVGDPLVVARLQHLLGVALRELRHPEEAEGLLVKAWRTRDRLLGTDHLDTVTTKHHVAVLYRNQGKYAQAEALFDEVLAIRTARLGTDDLETLATRHHLVVLYKSQKRYALAEALCEEVLASRTAKLGADDLDTLATKHNLATIYLVQEKHPLAEALFRDVVAGRTAKLGANYPDTLTSRHLLALVYRSQKKHDPAEALLEEVVAGRTAKLGADHLDTLDSQYDLASLYVDQGKFALAEAQYKEALAAYTTLLGADHIKTIFSRDRLAELYGSIKKFDQSIPLLEESLERRKAQLDPDDPEILGRTVALGANYCKAGRFEEGLALIEEVRQKGVSDPHPAWVRSALLMAYVQTGKTAEAVGLVAERVQEARQQFPADSLELAAALASTGQALVEVKAYADAEPLYQEVLAIRIAKLGANHDDTILPRDHLAQIYRSLKKPDQSIPLFQVSLELRKGQLAPDHGEILGRQVTLGAAYCDAGRFADGIGLIEDVRQKGRQDPHPAWVRSVLLTAYVQAGMTAEATSLVSERVQDARDEFPGDSPELAAALADNGKVLLDVKAYSDAEALLLEAYQGLRQTQRENERLRNVLDWLVKLYEAWGKPDEAAKWRKET